MARIANNVSNYRANGKVRRATLLNKTKAKAETIVALLSQSNAERKDIMVNHLSQLKSNSLSGLKRDHEFMP